MQEVSFPPSTLRRSSNSKQEKGRESSVPTRRVSEELKQCRGYTFCILHPALVVPDSPCQWRIEREKKKGEEEREEKEVYSERKLQMAVQSNGGLEKRRSKNPGLPIQRVRRSFLLDWGNRSWYRQCPRYRVNQDQGFNRFSSSLSDCQDNHNR